MLGAVQTEGKLQALPQTVTTRSHFLSPVILE